MPMRQRPFAAAAVIAAVLLALCFTASGLETRTVAEHNFAVETPEWWMAMTPQPQGAALAVESPRKERALTIISTELPPRDPATLRAEMVETAKKQLEAQVFQITNEAVVESGGLKWTTLEAATSRLKIVIWLTVLPHRAYLLRIDDKTGRNPVDDPEMLACLRSFRLLRDVQADGALAPEKRTPQRDTFVLGSRVVEISPLVPGVIIACVVLAGGIVLLAMWRSGRKKR